jgi:hypothetical protein
MIELTIAENGAGLAADAIAKIVEAMPEIIAKANGQAAHALRAAIVLGIRRQAPGGQQFKKLVRSTVLLRKLRRGKASTKALIDSGGLVGSINANRIGSTQAWFVGIHRTVRTKDGKEMVNLAEIHEYGTKPFKIRVTPKLRAWWNAMVKLKVFKKRMSPTKTFISHPGVPARPFMRPSFEAWAPTAGDTFATSFNNLLAKEFAKARAKVARAAAKKG